MPQPCDDNHIFCMICHEPQNHYNLRYQPGCYEGNDAVCQTAPTKSCKFHCMVLKPLKNHVPCECNILQALAKIAVNNVQKLSCYHMISVQYWLPSGKQLAILAPFGHA